MGQASVLSRAVAGLTTPAQQACKFAESTCEPCIGMFAIRAATNAGDSGKIRDIFVGIFSGSTYTFFQSTDF